jgi:hypothetical protein
LHVGGTLGVTGAATFSSSITTYGGLDITGIGYFRGSNNSTDNIRFYNTDGNYAYIRTTLASNTNNTWFDTPLGATLWLGWDNPGQARTASAYSQVYIGTGRGEVNESVRLYRGSIEGRDIFGNINYRIATSNTLGANTFFNYGNVLIGTSTDGGYKLDVTGTIRAFNSSSLIVSMSSNPANDAVIAARWTSGVGLEMRYNPNNALCYFDSTYPLTSNQVFGDMQFRVNAGGTMTPALTIKANNSNIGLLGNTTPEYRIDLCGYNAEFPSEVIRFGAYNGPSGGGGSTIGSGIMWKPYYSGYTRRSAGIMQIAENNYFRSGIGFFTNDNANTTSDWSERLRIYSAGNATFFSYVTATAFYESSDFRLKTLIESNPIIAGIEKLEAKLYEKNGKIELGYFAQDAELIMPYAVTKNEDGFLNLSYREVHTAKIARLEQRVAELEKQLNLN